MMQNSKENMGGGALMNFPGGKAGLLVLVLASLVVGAVGLNLLKNGEKDKEETSRGISEAGIRNTDTGKVAQISKRQARPCGTNSGTGCAATDKRVDLIETTFSHPTKIDNPLYPVASLKSSVFIGHVDGLPFRTETTLLPNSRVIKIDGKLVDALQYQYVAFSDGRIEEVALDSYAQDDAGNVWYLGEIVADYNSEGRIFTHEGTWEVGRKDAPMSMIMPAHPKLGDVWQAEDTAPEAWEEITVKNIGMTVKGSRNQISGALVGSELHMDGTRQQKIFVPGYGEFQTGTLENNDLESMALSVPIDAEKGVLPQELKDLFSKTAMVYAYAEKRDFSSVNNALADIERHWGGYKSVGKDKIPTLLSDEIARISPLLKKAVDSKNVSEIEVQVIAFAQVINDLRLQYLPITDVDKARLDLWMAQVVTDLNRKDFGGVRGDVATAEIIFERFNHVLEPKVAAKITQKLDKMRIASEEEETGNAMSLATEVRDLLLTGWK